MQMLEAHAGTELSPNSAYDASATHRAQTQITDEPFYTEMAGS